MQAEIKKQIIQELISKGVLVEENILGRLESVDDIDVLEKIKNNSSLILEEGSFSEISEKPISYTDFDNAESEISEKKEIISERKVKIVSVYEKPPHKRQYNDFVTLFNRRYKALMKILRQRQEMQNVISLARLNTKNERDSVAVIGMISEISETVNENIILTLEDDTGNFKVLISKNTSNKELARISRNLVLDEVIGVTGQMGNNIIFANSIIFPDIPLSKEFKKGPVEEYAVFMGDIHMGSKYFLEREFSKFTKWLNAEIGNPEQRKLAKKIRYLFVTGDLVEGVGIYPDQDKDLTEKDIYGQYKLFAEFAKNIPSYISIIICPGNHDASRIAEPQPKIDPHFAQELYEMDNVFMVSSPSVINIAATDTFSGFDVLMYHGYSFIYYADAVPYIREKGGQERIDLVMKFLLQRRHLAPTHGSTLYIPETTEDPLVISTIPDFFISGHIHRATYSTYRNISLINTSTWVGMTDFQEKLGLKPQPAKIIIANLKTRDMSLLNFEEKKEHKEEPKETDE